MSDKQAEQMPSVAHLLIVHRSIRFAPNASPSIRYIGKLLMKKTLWTIQILLALMFLFAGGSKFVMPVEQMTQGMPAVIASGGFIHFIGVCEVLGGLGLILPGLLRIKPGLTPLAASGLVIIMIGATLLSVPEGVVATVIPLVIGILAAFVAYGRWRLAPL
jgi:hypothetical protein